MSDYNDEYDDAEVEAAEQRTEPESPRKNDWRRRLEADAEAGRKAQAEAAQARRELAFLKAGVDLESPLGKLFAKGYDGDLTPDAVKSAAVEAGIVEQPQAAVPQEELAAHDRFAQAAGGATSQTDEQAYLTDLEAAQSEADVLAVLARADAGLIDQDSRVAKWVYGGGQNTPVTTPRQ